MCGKHDSHFCSIHQYWYFYWAEWLGNSPGFQISWIMTFFFFFASPSYVLIGALCSVNFSVLGFIGYCPHSFHSYCLKSDPRTYYTNFQLSFLLLWFWALIFQKTIENHCKQQKQFFLQVFQKLHNLWMIDTIGKTYYFSYFL